MLWGHFPLCQRSLPHKVERLLVFETRSLAIRTKFQQLSHSYDTTYEATRTPNPVQLGETLRSHACERPVIALESSWCSGGEAEREVTQARAAKAAGGAGRRRRASERAALSAHTFLPRHVLLCYRHTSGSTRFDHKIKACFTPSRTSRNASSCGKEVAYCRSQNHATFILKFSTGK